MGALDAQLNAATAKALEELAHKTIYVVQCETALTWSGRALAAYAMYAQTGEPRCLSDAGEYAHEALEHAALAGPHIYGPVYARLHDMMMSVMSIPPSGT
jgi:hypothetical protein